MNCSPGICIGLLLLALSSGMFLLNKTQKDNLGGFFRFVSWFIIVASFLGMIHCALRCCMWHNECREMERCEGMGECSMGMHGGMNKRIMIFKGGEGECEMDGECMKGGKCCEMSCCKMNGGGGCGEMEEGGCKEGKMDCCKEGKEKCEMKMEMKKDSVMKHK